METDDKDGIKDSKYQPRPEINGLSNGYQMVYFLFFCFFVFYK